MQVSPIDKNVEHKASTFQKVLSKSKHQHYELLTFREATALIYEREGIKGYYRGFLPSIIKNTLNAGTYFSTLHYFRMVLTLTNMNEHAVNFWASAGARAIQAVLCNPLIVVKTRLEVLGFQEYNGLSDAMVKVYQKEGLGGFFTGLKISLIRDVPFSGIFFPIYEHSKKLFNFLLMFDPNDPTAKNRALYITAVSALSSIFANIMSCVITHPLDIIRTRVFFQYYNKDQTQHYQSIMQAVLKIYEYDGLIGYFRGLTPRLMRKGVGTILAWGIYEYLVDKRSGSYID